MKQAIIRALQIVATVIGLVVFGFLLWEPHVEGVNAHAAFFEVYWDPFLAYVYLGSIPFFVGVYYTLRVLRLASSNSLHTPAAQKSFRTIKYCAVATIVFALLGEVFIMLQSSDDRAGGFFMGFLVCLGSAATIVAVTIAQKSTAVGY